MMEIESMRIIVITMAKVEEMVILGIAILIICSFCSTFLKYFSIKKL